MVRFHGGQLSPNLIGVIMEDGFRKSSFCEAGACVEVSMPTFIKSSTCEASACVEVAILDHVSIRNSTNPQSVVQFTREEWRAFVEGVKNNEFDIEV